MRAEELFAGFAHDPRDPAHAGLRASDADRERVRGVLADAFADGRLDREEYDERTATLLTTRILGDLPALVADLVAPEPGPALAGSGLERATTADLQARAERTWESQRRAALFGFLGPSLICWVIWVALGTGQAGGFDPGFPWPLIVTAVTGLRAIRTALSHDEVVAEELRRLQKKQAKALRPPEPE